LAAAEELFEHLALVGRGRARRQQGRKEGGHVGQEFM
jgi:hypothetical protein